MRAFHSAAAPQFPHLSLKTYAAHPVWKGSTTEEIKFSPLSKKEAVRIFHHARRFERQTAITRRDAFGKISTQGRLGRMGILVLHTMVFDFLNFKSGRLDPSYAAIAAMACVSVRSVARALVRLRDAGILNWVKRCAGRMIDDHYTLEQETNAYGVCSTGHWKGYSAPPDTPPPDPGAWGASPPLPALGLAAGDGARRIQTVLGAAPAGSLGAALLQLAKRRSV